MAPQTLGWEAPAHWLWFVQVEAAQQESRQLRAQCEALQEKNLEMG